LNGSKTKSVEEVKKYVDELIEQIGLKSRALVWREFDAPTLE
jgi:hypothetical protein